MRGSQDLLPNAWRRGWQWSAEGEAQREISSATGNIVTEASPRIRRMTHSFAAHLPRFSYNIQHVMLIQLRRLWRTRRARTRASLKAVDASRECPATLRAILQSERGGDAALALGPLGMTHLENNEAPANDRGCVADASHVS